MNEFRLLRAFWLSTISTTVVVLNVRALSLDFGPIVGYFDEMAKIPGFWDRLSYSFTGNMVMGFIIDCLVPGDGVEKTYVLYGLAAFLRCMVLGYILPARYAVFALFSSYIILELNQARLSLALTALFVFFATERKGFLALAAASHLSVLPILPLYYWKPTKWLLPFFVVIVSLVVLSAGIFPRYFSGMHDYGLPLNTFLYFSFAALLYYFLWRAGQYVHDFWFFLFFASLIFFLIGFGFAPVYVGRIAELCWHIAVFRFLRYYGTSRLIEYSVSVNRADMFVATSFVCMVVLGVYKLLLLAGNIWSYF